MLTCFLHRPEGAFEVRLLHASADEHRPPFNSTSFLLALASMCIHWQADMPRRDTQCKSSMLSEVSGRSAAHLVS